MKKLLAALVLALLAYVASPYAALALVMRAATQDDEAALSSRVDFEALRASLTQQLEARMNRPGGSDPGASMLPMLVNTYVTPRGLSMMLRSRTEPPVSGPEVSGSAASSASLGNLELDWIFFTGPTRFEVHSRRGVLVLEPRGLWWRVVDLRLPPTQVGPAPRTPPIEPPVATEAPDLEVPDFGASSPASGS